MFRFRLCDVLNRFCVVKFAYSFGKFSAVAQEKLSTLQQNQSTVRIFQPQQQRELADFVERTKRHARECSLHVCEKGKPQRTRKATQLNGIWYESKMIPKGNRAANNMNYDYDHSIDAPS